MIRSKKTERKLTRGIVSIAAIETFHYKAPSSFEVRNERRRETPLKAVLEDLRAVSAKLGHFPSRLEYKEHGQHFHKKVVYMNGLQRLAKMIGVEGPPPGMKRRKRDEKDMEHRCFNQELCEKTPPKKVPTKQTYCDECKVARGWGNFRTEYND